MRIRAAYLFVLAIFPTFAAGQLAPTGLEYSPAVNSTSMHYQYTGLFESIRKVDFANLYYYDGDGTTGDLFKLQRGNAKVKFPALGGEEITLEHVYYFHPSKDEPEAALVQLTWFSYGGSSSMDCLLLVFRIDDAGLVQTQQLRFDLQAKGAGADFDPGTNTLTVRARSNDDSSHCCPKSVDIVRFAWTGKTFEEKSHRTVPVKK